MFVCFPVFHVYSNTPAPSSIFFQNRFGGTDAYQNGNTQFSNDNTQPFNGQEQNNENDYKNKYENEFSPNVANSNYDQNYQTSSETNSHPSKDKYKVPDLNRGPVNDDKKMVQQKDQSNSDGNIGGTILSTQYNNNGFKNEEIQLDNLNYQTKNTQNIQPNRENKNEPTHLETVTNSYPYSMPGIVIPINGNNKNDNNFNDNNPHRHYMTHVYDEDRIIAPNESGKLDIIFPPTISSDENLPSKSHKTFSNA